MITLILDQKGRLWSRLEGGAPISPAEAFASLRAGTDQQFRLFAVDSTYGATLEPQALRAGTTSMTLKALLRRISGELEVTTGGETCVAYGETLQQIAQTLQAGLNSLSTIHTAGGVTVHVHGNRALSILFNEEGAQTAVTVNATGLRPQPDATVSTPITGDATTREQQRITLGEKTLINTSSFSNIDNQEYYEFEDIGDDNRATFYEIAITDPPPAGGSFTLETTGGNVTDPIDIKIGSKKLEVTILNYPDFRPSLPGDTSNANWTVVKPAPYTWQLTNALTGARPTFTADISGVQFHPGVIATVDLSTIATWAQATDGNLQLEATIRTDLTGRGDAEIFRAMFSLPAKNLEN